MSHKLPAVPDLALLAVSGAQVEVRVIPGASRVRIEADNPIRIWVNEAPDRGRATAAARHLLAKAMRIAPSRLKLKRGTTSRLKTFEVL